MHIKSTSQAINKFCTGLLLLLANVRKWLYRRTFDGIKSHYVSRSTHNCVWHEKMAIGSSADLWVHLMKTCPSYVSNEVYLGRYAIIFMIILFSFNTYCNFRFLQWWFSLNSHYILIKVQDGVQGMTRTWFWTRRFMYYDNNTYCISNICSFLTKNKQEIFSNVPLIVTKTISQIYFFCRVIYDVLWTGFDLKIIWKQSNYR